MSRAIRISPLAAGLTATVIALMPATTASEITLPRAPRHDGRTSADGFSSSSEIRIATISPRAIAGQGVSTMLIEPQSVFVSTSADYRSQPGVTILEAVMRRIQAARGLSDGWLGDGSHAPDAALLGWLEGHAQLLAESAHVISVVPIADGGVALQWTDSAKEFTAELHPDHVLYCYIDNTVTDEFEESSTEISGIALERFIRGGQLA